MDDFAFPDEENLLKMQKEYEKVLGGKTVVSSLSLSKNGRPVNKNASCGLLGYSCRNFCTSPPQFALMHQRRHCSCSSSKP